MEDKTINALDRRISIAARGTILLWILLLLVSGLSVPFIALTSQNH